MLLRKLGIYLHQHSVLFPRKAGSEGTFIAQTIFRFYKLD